MDLIERTRCCGCGACANACVVKAINMQEDKEGFLFPIIDENKCIECGKCVRVCPVHHPNQQHSGVMRAFAIRTNDSNVLRTSTSGGISYEIARLVVERGGAACGAVFDSKNEVEHMIIDCVDDLNKLQGSKYVQSKIGSSYQEIKRLLDSRKPIVFIGTPCQVQGMKAFLGKEYENLINIDFICHGVPSPKVWRAYLHQEKLEHSRIVFRDKRKGWESNSEFLAERSGKKVKREPFYVNPFYWLFANNYILRECCYNCEFKNGYNSSDITVADCWGISKLLKDYPDDDRGMSVCYVRTQKGMEIISALKDRVWMQEISYDAAIAENMMMLQSVKRPTARDVIFEELLTEKVQSVFRRYKPKEPMILTIKKKLYPIKKLLMK